MNRKIHPAAFEQAVERLRQEESVIAAYLLGSAACDALREDSDIDIALLCRHDRPLDAIEKLYLAGDLTAILGRPVDLGMMTSSNVVYGKEVAAHGKLLFTHDPYACSEAISRFLSMYADLQTTRRPVLAAYDLHSR